MDSGVPVSRAYSLGQLGDLGVGDWAPYFDPHMSHPGPMDVHSTRGIASNASIAVRCSCYGLSGSARVSSESVLVNIWERCTVKSAFKHLDTSAFCSQSQRFRAPDAMFPEQRPFAVGTFLFKHTFLGHQGHAYNQR